MKHLFTTSVGRKFLVGITGIGVSGFALTHMAGNLLLLSGPKAFNLYGAAITSNPFIVPAEIALAMLFLAHIGLAMWLAYLNCKSRPVSPAKGAQGDKSATFASRTMVYSGLLLLVFLGFHVWSFRLGPHYPVIYDGVEYRDLYRVVYEYFQNPWGVAWYVFALVVLGLHLSHGISAVFQSLGISGANHPVLRKLAWGFAIIVAGGFITQALYVHFCGGQ